MSQIGRSWLLTMFVSVGRKLELDVIERIWPRRLGAWSQVVQGNKYFSLA